MPVLKIYKKPWKANQMEFYRKISKTMQIRYLILVPKICKKPSDIS